RIGACRLAETYSAKAVSAHLSHVGDVKDATTIPCSSVEESWCAHNKADGRWFESSHGNYTLLTQMTGNYHMNAIKEAIQALTQAEWKELYQWALLEERKRREREAIKEELITEILGEGEPSEEGTKQDK